MTSTLLSRISTLRAGLAKHPEHAELLANTIGMTGVAERLATLQTAVQSAQTQEDATDASLAATRLARKETWNQLQKAVRQLTNLLEWQLEKSHGSLLAGLRGIPTSRRADERAQNLIDFVASHAELTTNGLIAQERSEVEAMLQGYRAAVAAAPAEQAGEDTADNALREAQGGADTYADCLEMVLRRLLRGDTAALHDYDLAPTPHRISSESAPGGVTA